MNNNDITPLGLVLWIGVIIGMLALAECWWPAQPRDPASGSHIPAEVHGTLD